MNERKGGGHKKGKREKKRWGGGQPERSGNKDAFKIE